VFWTVPAPADSVRVEADNKTISWRLTNFAIGDYHDLKNALLLPQPGPSVPAMISFTIKWGDVLNVVDVRDATNTFAGIHIERKATIEWEADQEGFRFVSDPANTSRNVYSVTADERNGVFFS